MIEGTHNFRDVGGIPLSAGGSVSSGRLYRSDALSALTATGLVQLAEAGVETIVDFRTPLERSLAPDVLPNPGPALVELPILEGALTGLAQQALATQNGSAGITAAAVDAALAGVPSLDELYIAMLEHSADSFAAVARLVGTSDGAVVAHCTAGKDRTGVAVALVLAAIGADRAAIVEDYARSEANLAGAWADGMRTMITSMGVPITPALDALVTASPPEAIDGALAWVDDRGGAADYLRSAGLTESELDALRSRLT